MCYSVALLRDHFYRPSMQMFRLSNFMNQVPRHEDGKLDLLSGETGRKHEAKV